MSADTNQLQFETAKRDRYKARVEAAALAIAAAGGWEEPGDGPEDWARCIVYRAQKLIAAIDEATK